MRLSEAMRLGAMMGPQAFRVLFTEDGACALGAALLAVGAASQPHLRAVLDQWPWALTVSANCPSCGRSCPVFGVITHLNDSHRWAREQIARWVAGVEPTDRFPRRRRGRRPLIFPGCRKVSHRFPGWARKAKLPGKVTSHTLRHTFASRLVMAGADLLTVKALGGWNRLEMVERYAHLAPAHKRAAVERLAQADPLRSEGRQPREWHRDFGGGRGR